MAMAKTRLKLLKKAIVCEVLRLFFPEFLTGMADACNWRGFLDPGWVFSTVV